MKYLKELLKEKKYVPVIIAALVVTEAFLFTFLRISLAENREISDPVCLSCCSGIYRFKKNTDSQSASDYDACGKSHASDWRDRSRACMVEGMSEICIWRSWYWPGDFPGSLVFVKKKHWNGRCEACCRDRLVSGRLPDLV